MIGSLFAACSEKDQPYVEPTPGQEVVFGVAEQTQSRTMYGPFDEANNQYPILWAKDDRMLVMSPQGAIKQGEYQVSSEVGEAGAASAGTLVRIGSSGVQWGSEPTADFYSVYPYGKVEAVNPGRRMVTMRMPDVQIDYFTSKQQEDGSYNYEATADMNGSILYARNEDVANGTNPVPLGYKSLSTAIRFTLKGPEDPNVRTLIQSVGISANGKKIAGKMNVTFTEGAEKPAVAFDATDSYDKVMIYAPYKTEGGGGGGYLTLEQNQSMELNAFIMIDQDTDISDWTITVNTLTKTYTKKLSGTLQTGKIHRIILPALGPDSSSEWDVANWMTNIRRNTYLCEISVPGSWNSLNPDFQESTDISKQYEKGARAFHLDTRWMAENNTILGVAAGSATGGGTNNYTNGPSVKDALQEMKDNLKTNEFMYVICTFAQGSAKPQGQSWEQAISDLIKDDDDFFDGKDLTPQTTINDVLGQIVVICNTEGVTPSNLSSSKCLYVDAPLKLTSGIFSATPPYNEKDIYWGNGAASAVKMIVSQCQAQFNGDSSWGGGPGNDNSGRGYLPSYDDRMAQLEAVLEWSRTNYTGAADATGADRMILLGIGGKLARYNLIGSFSDVAGSEATVAGQYGTWIYNKIQAMENHEDNFYPVGIVLMNDVTNGTETETNIGTGSDQTALTGPVVMKKILMLNNLYQQRFDPNEPAWPYIGEPKPEDFSASNIDGGNAWSVIEQQ